MMTRKQLLQALSRIRGYKIKTKFGYGTTQERLFFGETEMNVKLIKQDLTICLDVGDIIKWNIEGGINEDDFQDLALTVDLTDGKLRYKW